MLFPLVPAPNPARDATTIHFRLRAAGLGKVEISDILGWPVRAVVEAEFEAGEHSVAWDSRDNRGRRMASGLYYFRLHAGGIVKARPLVVF
jgi:hypothetical protein